MPKLKIDLADLVQALDTHSGEIIYYLDKETGEIFFITEDIRFEYTRLREAYNTEQEGNVNWEKAIEEGEVADWMLKYLRKLELLNKQSMARFVEIEPSSSHEGFTDMEEFIDSVRDMRLQQRLNLALRERHPFKNFKIALDYYPAERQRWFRFKNDRTLERAREWLKREGIEVEEGG